LHVAFAGLLNWPKGIYVMSWQAEFAGMLPELETLFRRQFQWLSGDTREEAIQEAIVSALIAYSRLKERGKAHVATATTLAYYALKHVKRGRPAVGRMSKREPMSRYAQLGSGLQREMWIADITDDKYAPVPDVVATRLDCRAWFATLPRRIRRIATDLAVGFTTAEMARRYGLTAGRISQIRRELETSWRAFQQSN
jgi:hypothetical protein